MIITNRGSGGKSKVNSMLSCRHWKELLVSKISGDNETEFRCGYYTSVANNPWIVFFQINVRFYSQQRIIKRLWYKRFSF